MTLLSNHPRAATIVSALGLCALPASAEAGGIFIPGSGAQAQARAGAYVAKADDPSTIAHNPAGFAKIPGTVVYLGANLVNLSLDYHRAGAYEDSPADYAYEGQPYAPISEESSPAVGFAGFQAVPMIVVSSDLGMPDLGLRIGAGVFAPHGYPEREFAGDYNFEDPDVPPPPQRYDVMSQQAAAVLPSLAVAYSVLDNLDVGVRASWGIAHISAETYLWGIQNYEENIANDGIFSIDVEDNFVPAFGVGLLYRPLPMLEIGAAYNSAMNIYAEGEGRPVLGSGLEMLGVNITPVPDEEAQCATGGTVDALKTCIEFAIPQTASLGSRWILRDGARERADVEFDVKWENWSAEQATDYLIIVDGETVLGDLNCRINPETGERFCHALRHGFEDVWSFRLGGSYTMPLGEGKNALTFRGGAAYDTAAASDNYQRLDVDGASRVTLGAGASLAVGRFQIDLGAGAVLEPDRIAAECVTDATMPSCDGADEPPASEDRGFPDPLQPAFDPRQQRQSPFNAGEYSSGYLLFSLAVSAMF